MFWGLILEPMRRYSQKVSKPFHISMASLDIQATDNEATQIMLLYEKKNYLLCTLQKDKVVQCPLDLNFEAGDIICFATNGDSNVHLTGYLHEVDELDEDLDEEEETEITSKKKRKHDKSIIEPAVKKSKTAKLLESLDNYDSNEDASFSLQDIEDDEEEEESDSEVANDEEYSEDEDSDVEDISDEESEQEPEQSPKTSPQTNGKFVKETFQNSKQSPKNKLGEKTPSKVGNQKENKTPGKQEARTPKNEEKNKKTPKQTPQKKRTLAGGVIVEELKTGEGVIAKPGKMVEVYYEGRLQQNNKMFDQNKKGNGFRFRLGKQEVIKGWDIGVAGMKVGEKRRITCPPQVAYGQKGSPPVIPPNSTLVFEVELKNVH